MAGTEAGMEGTVEDTEDTVEDTAGMEDTVTEDTVDTEVTEDTAEDMVDMADTKPQVRFYEFLDRWWNTMSCPILYTGRARVRIDGGGGVNPLHFPCSFHCDPQPPPLSSCSVADPPSSLFTIRTLGRATYHGETLRLYNLYLL